MPDTISKSYTIKDSGNANLLARVSPSGYLYTNPEGVQLPITNLNSGFSGTFTDFSFNQDNGALIAQIPNLDRTADSISVYPGVGSSVLGQQGPRTGIGTILNAGQRNLGYVQNVGINPILVALSGTAAANNFSFILKGGSVALDGNGSSWTSDSWYGSVSVSGSGISYVCWEY